MLRIKDVTSSTLHGCPIKADAPVGYNSGEIMATVQTAENNFRLLSWNENLELINIFFRYISECFSGKSMFMRQESGEQK